MRFIGRINPGLYELEFGKLQTDEVVLMHERELHIKEHHFDDLILLETHGKEIINNPDIVLCDIKNKGTVFLVKSLSESNLNMVLRLALETDFQGRKNSIMTFYRIRESNLKKLMNRNKILYKK